MPRQSVQPGDVFRLLPLSNRTHGFGQVLAPYGSSGGRFYLGIFGSAHVSENPSVERVLGDELVFMALSVDALLSRDHWIVVGHAEVRASTIHWPEYKVATSPGVYEVEDAFAATTRPATAKDIAVLPFRSVVAPIRLQHAFEALHREREWLPEYAALRANSLLH